LPPPRELGVLVENNIVLVGCGVRADAVVVLLDEAVVVGRPDRLEWQLWEGSVKDRRLLWWWVITNDALKELHALLAGELGVEMIDEFGVVVNRVDVDFQLFTQWFDQPAPRRQPSIEGHACANEKGAGPEFQSPPESLDQPVDIIFIVSHHNLPPAPTHSEQCRPATATDLVVGTI